MRLTKQTGYAIRILTDCAMAPGELIKVASLSKRLGITKQNVFKIVHVLSRARFIVAVRGPNGGVRLAREPEDIKIGDVVRAVEVTKIKVDGHAAKGERASTETGTITSLFDDALAAFVSVLDQHTLASLAAQPTPERMNQSRNAPKSRAKTSAQPQRPGRRPVAAGRPA